MDAKTVPISLDEIVAARALLRNYLLPTNLIHYAELSTAIGASVYIKHENHNPTGSFKIRGGLNLAHHLKQANAKGVITFSTGNHGLSIAAAQRFGLPATVVVPENNNPVKNRAITSFGAELIEGGANFDAASQLVDELCRERGLYFAHPCNEPLLVNGVGTGFLEIVESLPDVDVVIVPLGGGSEAAAASVALRPLSSRIEIIAVQAMESPAAFNSWRSGTIESAPNRTFAGGLATGNAYRIPFEIYRDTITEFVLLSEEELYDAMGAAMFYTRNIAEGAGAASLGAAWKLRRQLHGKKVALQMSGCNASHSEIQKALCRESSVRGFEN